MSNDETSRKMLPGDLYGNWTKLEEKILFQYYSFVSDVNDTYICLLAFPKLTSIKWRHFDFYSVDGFFIRNSIIYASGTLQHYCEFQKCEKILSLKNRVY